MPRLTSIVHVSTSYVNFHLGPQIQELLYPYPLCHYSSSSPASLSSSYSSSFSDPDQLLENLTAMTDDTLSTYEREVVLQVFPNTYVMSKSLAEHLLQSWSRSMQLPMVIVRPAAVTGSLAEPMPGWAEGMVGFHGIMVQTATAQVREWVAYEVKRTIYSQGMQLYTRTHSIDVRFLLYLHPSLLLSLSLSLICSFAFSKLS